VRVHDRNQHLTDPDEVERDDVAGIPGEREDVVAGARSGARAGGQTARDGPLARGRLDYGDGRPARRFLWPP